MNKINDILTLRASHQTLVGLLFGVLGGVYLLNFHINDIWTPNESFYADAVREMFESGNFLDIKYNYEPRYNKPPLTYWLMALSSGVFGINEFGLRLPMVLTGLGSIWFTYLLGRLQFGEKGGLYAMMMMGVSVQLLAVKQYASPEVPLTFFFVASLYYSLKGYRERSFKNILLFYILLGLAVLIKGYPYIVVIGGIAGLFVLLENKLQWKGIWKDILFLKPHFGLPLVIALGLSWIFYMYWKDGQEFWLVYKRETFDRAFTRKESSMRWFFYFKVMAWTILPYSIAFYFAAIKWIRDWKKAKVILFPFCWLIVMLVIFTFSKGKIPTYFIQAHPAMIFMIIPILLEKSDLKGLWRILWNSTFIIPATLVLIGTGVMIYELQLFPALYLLIPIGGYLLMKLTKKVHSEQLVTVPFWITLMFLIAFSLYLPKMEAFRPYDEIGSIINNDLKINREIPIHIDKTLIHNIPFYTERKAIRNEDIIAYWKNTRNDKLALVKDNTLKELTGYRSVWNGWIYNSSSESQFFKFVMACRQASNGEFGKFAKYHLIVEE